MSYLNKFFYIFSGQQRQLWILIAIFLGTSLLEAFGIGMIGPFLSLASDPSLIDSNSVLRVLYGSYSFTSKTEFIILIGLAIVAVFIVKSIAFILGKTYSLRTLFRQRAKIQRRLFDAYINARYDFHVTRNTADFINKISTETSRFTYLVSLPLIELASQLVVVVMLVGLMAATDWLLFAIAVGTLLPAALVFLALGSSIKSWGKKSSLAREGTLKVINHGLGGLKETRVIGCEDYFRRELTHHTLEEASMETRFLAAQFIPRTLIEALLVTAVVGYICLSQIQLGQDFQAAVSTMGVFAVASLRLVPAASQLVQCLGSLRNSVHTLEMIYLDLKEIEGQEWHQPTMPQLSSGAALGFTSDIVLQHILYRYPKSKSLSLEDISMSIKKGESIGLIGQSGAGKTTLVDVILGLLIPQSGDIKVDGTSIYSDLNGWKTLVGYIPQSIFLMDDTIEHNIAFGVADDEIDNGRLQYAIQAAQLETLVQDLPDGLDTSVGERGVRLSGGQRQRIGIARALYHQREVLVLDEATSALDNETERLINDAIQALAGVKTLIIIAHRLSTIEHCDRIYVLEKGQVARSGNYHDVVVSN